MVTLVMLPTRPSETVFHSLGISFWVVTKLILATRLTDSSNTSEWPSWRYADQLWTGVLVISAEVSHGICYTLWENGKYRMNHCCKYH